MKGLIGIIIFIALAVFGFYVFSPNQEVINNDNESMEGDSMMESEFDDSMAGGSMSNSEDGADPMMETNMESEDSMVESAGVYEDYSSEKISMATTGKMVLFFHADWCPFCRSLDQNLQSNLENIPEGISILKVDYDTSQDLRVKYGVTTQHTFVQVDENGNEIAQWTGSSNLDELLLKIN